MFIGLLFLPLAARAHALDVTTARISLRDAHIEVFVEVDSVKLVVLYSGAAKDAASLAAASDAELEAWVAAARIATERGTQLRVNAVQVPLVLRAFPTATEVRGMAAQLAASPTAHLEMSAIRFETTAVVANAASVTFELPQPMGRVLCSFVQPAMHLAAAGEASTFSVLSQASAPTMQPSMLASRATCLATAAGVLAMLALLLALVAKWNEYRPRNVIQLQRVRS
jgi:hypothetical protein